jgi:hypothetical protein
MDRAAQAMFGEDDLPLRRRRPGLQRVDNPQPHLLPGRIAQHAREVGAPDAPPGQDRPARAGKRGEGTGTLVRQCRIQAGEHAVQHVGDDSSGERPIQQRVHHLIAVVIQTVVTGASAVRVLACLAQRKG